MTSMKMTQRLYRVGILALFLFVVLNACAKPELERIEITPSEKRLDVGVSISFKADAISSKNEQMPDVAFTWTVDGEAGTIDEKGRFIAQKPGYVKVAATSGNISAQAQIAVLPVKVAVIEVQADKAKALAGTTAKLKVKALSQKGQPAGYNPILILSPTEGVKLSTESLTLDSQGETEIELALSPNPGPNKVVLKSGELTKEIEIEGTAITRIAITPEKKVYEVGESVQFTAEGYDKFGNHRSIEAKWSMAPQNAVLKDSGMVVMKKPGKSILLAEFKKITQGLPFTIVPGKLDKIELKPDAIKLQAGKTIRIQTKGFNKYGYRLPLDVEWTVEKELGTIAGDGTFMAKKAGKGIIWASKGGVSSEVKVEIEHGPLADIKIKIKEKHVEAGNVVDLQATGVDAFGNEFSIDPDWLLSKSLGTIDREKSTFTALYTGTGEIRAKTGNILTAYPIEVTPSALSRLQISPESVDMLAGETKQFIVKGFDRFGNQITIQPRLSLKKDLGELSPDGVFKAKKDGNTKIEAGVENLTADSTISVAPADMELAVIEPKGPLSLKAGEVQQFSASGLDAFGNTVKSAVNWSLTTNLGTIDDQGVFIPTKIGQGQVVAAVRQLRTDKVLNFRVPINIAPGEPARIEVEPVKFKMTAGEEKHFVAAMYDAYGNKTVTALKWSVDEFPDVSIDHKGLFKAVKAGTGKIRATAGNLMAEAEVQVLPAEISFLKITPETVTLKAGDKIQLDAVEEDRFGNVVDVQVLWSLTDKRLGTFTSENSFVAKKEGKGFLMATARNIVERVPVEVKTGPLFSIKVMPLIKNVSSGKEIQFKAIGYDVGGNELAAKPTWSVPKDIGSIDNNGLFIAQKAGAGSVVAESNGIKATAEINVMPGEPAFISVIPEKITATAGDRVKLEFTVLDANKNLITVPEYNWTVEGELGSVTRDNLFQAHKAGKGLITVVSGKATAKIPVEVIVGSVNRITVSPETATLNAGSHITFEARGYDKEGNEVELKAVWTVSGQIGTIDKNGEFEAQIAGHGNISCQMAAIFGLSSVEVKPGPVESIKIDPPETTLTAGESAAFGATAYDAYGNICPADFSWDVEADKSLGIFATPGRFKPETAGEGKIVASVDKVKGYSKIKVKPATLNRVVVFPKSLSLISGEDARLRAEGRDPFNNIIPVFPRWFLDPKELGQMAPEGIFYAQKAGKGTLKATSEGFESSVTIEVKPGEPKYLSIKAPASDIAAGKTYPFTAVGYDEGGNVFPIKAEWAVTRDLGRIEKDTGIFHATKAGKGAVVAYSGEIVADMPVEVKPGALQYVFVEPNTVTVVSNSKQEFVASGLDIEKNRVELPSPLWEVQGGIGIFEKPGIFRGTSQGKGKVTAIVGKLQAEAYVTVVPGKPDPANSRIRLTHITVPADGVSLAEIIVEVRDTHNNLIPGVEVKLISDRQSDVIHQPARTDQRGMVTGSIRSTEPGASTISAVIEETPFWDTARVVFKTL
ncbi:MAG: Ig-like domain-containing protein [Deltaproteobacteria bacterium]|nr:Ig-like domain-containing protein [Deltaproteobacteria bacterium]